MSWELYTGHIAWPTLALVALVALCNGALVYAGTVGLLPLWLASVLLVPVAYAWFTPLHEAVHGNIGGKRSLWRTILTWFCCAAAAKPSTIRARSFSRSSRTARRASCCASACTRLTSCSTSLPNLPV